MNNKDRSELLEKYINGTASKEESELLENLLLDDESFRDEYISMMNLDAGLREAAESVAEFEEKIELKQVKSFPKWIIPLAAAIVILLTLNLTYLIKNTTPVQAKVEEPLQSGIALITKAVDIQGNESLLNRGQTLDEGKLKFESGILQVDFYSGATLIFEGPADIDLIDSMNIVCQQGKIRARVSPQAKGFKIKTTDLDVVDLGTEFALDVPKSGNASVFVYEGEVELKSKVDQKLLRSLGKDNGVTWTKEEISDIPMRDDFVSFETINELDDKFSQTKLDNWRAFAEDIKRREDVILFYSFEGEKKWSKTIHNKSQTQIPELNGAIVGCNWSQGRWPGKKALEFKSTGDRIKLEIPGSYKDMTFSCWVRIEGFDRWLSSLILTDNYKKGALHWQLSDSGEIILGANSNGNTFSPPVIAPKDLGRWIHIATVYNSIKKEIVHYLNGQPVIRDVLKRPQDIILGKADIGNWTSSAKSNAIRSLNGRLDEFIIFSTPLGDQEIEDLYRQGTPD